MWAEFFELRSASGVTFEIKGINLTGQDLRIEGPDDEWYWLKPSTSDSFEWSMWHGEWNDFAVVDKKEPRLREITWEQAKMWLIPQ